MMYFFEKPLLGFFGLDLWFLCPQDCHGRDRAWLMALVTTEISNFRRCMHGVLILLHRKGLKLWGQEVTTRGLNLGFSVTGLSLSLSTPSHILPSVCVPGVRASERLAERDRPYLLRYQPMMRIVGRKYCMDPAVIAGVLSRESQGGNFVVDMGNMGNGIGVIQVMLHQSRWLDAEEMGPWEDMKT